MPRLLLLDLGETLVHDGDPFPHVTEALQVFSQLEAPDGELLTTCLVSDYHLAEPAGDPARIDALFDEYLDLLADTGLADFFEPVDERVTLSTHAGVMKPDPRVFELAAERSGTDASFEESLFITEHAGHVEAARALGITALRFDPGPEAEADFHDSCEAPLLVQRLVSPGLEVGLAQALSVCRVFPLPCGPECPVE